MKTIRRTIALAFCGILLGASMSFLGAAPATAKLYAGCDNKVDAMERQAARDYEKGKLSADDYAKVQEEIALHRALWGC